jgi:hypothetical protein
VTLRIAALCVGLLALPGCSTDDAELKEAVVACVPQVERALGRVQEGLPYTTVLRRWEAGVIVGPMMPGPNWRTPSVVAFRCMVEETDAPAEVLAVVGSPPASGVESWASMSVQWTWDAEDGFSAVFTDY